MDRQRVHVVTVPQRGAGSLLVLHRFAEIHMSFGTWGTTCSLTRDTSSPEPDMGHGVETVARQINRDLAGG